MEPLTTAELARYSRHVLLPEIGIEGQTRLKNARILVVGAGGLGSPAALYLAAAGIGTIGLADFDHVEAHNLHRQLLHRDNSIGQPKVDSAAARLREINPFLTVQTHPAGVTAENAEALFASYDVIVDGTDNFGSRYLNNDAAVRAQKPLVFGSVYRFEGQVSVFAPHLGGPCYRCLFPEPPPAGSVPGCGEVGILGAVCGVIGSWQALETIKLITSCGTPLIGRLLTYDALAQNVETLAFKPHASCECREATKLGRLDPAVYEAIVCPVKPISSSIMTDASYPLEISVAETKRLLESTEKKVRLIDVREPHELQICRIAGATHIPMRQIPEHMPTLSKTEHLLIQCHHGSRSLSVTEYLRAQGFNAVSNVAGGIDAWAQQFDPKMQRY
jgi:molybdopterin/thiamine biosynthesis adenylyltransferase/rhodanese-related sulfurtransferase